MIVLYLFGLKKRFNLLELVLVVTLLMLIIFLINSFLITGGNFWQKDSYQYFGGIIEINEKGYIPQFENLSLTYSTYGFYLLSLISSILVGNNSILFFFLFGILISISLLVPFFYALLNNSYDSKNPLIEGLFLIFGIGSFFIAGLAQFAPQSLGTSILLVLAFLESKHQNSNSPKLYLILQILFAIILLLVHLWSFFFFFFCYILLSIYLLLHRKSQNLLIEKSAITLLFLSFLSIYIFFSPWIDTSNISKYNSYIPYLFILGIFALISIYYFCYSLKGVEKHLSLYLTFLSEMVNKHFFAIACFSFFVFLSSILILYGLNLYPTTSGVLDVISNHFLLVVFSVLLFLGSIRLFLDKDYSSSFKSILFANLFGSLIFLFLSFLLLSIGVRLFFPWRHIVYLSLFSPFILSFTYRKILLSNQKKNLFFAILLVLILIVSSSGYQFYYSDQEILSAEWSNNHTNPDHFFLTDNRLQGLFSGFIDRVVIWKKEFFYTAPLDAIYLQELEEYNLRYIILSSEFSIQGARFDELGGSYNIYNDFIQIEEYPFFNKVYSNGDVSILFYNIGGNYGE